MKSKVAIITGITGQDGSYLAQNLLSLGYKVYGVYRRTASVNFWRLEFLNVLNHKNLILVEGDITDLSSCISLIRNSRPSEIYNLAAQSFVGVSFDQPLLTTQTTAVGCLNLLEAIRLTDSTIKFYQASTSEMFGLVQEIPQNEKTPFYPRSPYGVSKLYAHWMVINYRESYDIFAVSGILFNHESPLRGLEFVTRKITDGVAKIKLGLQSQIELGNLDSKRDWGYAKEYVEGMRLMLNHSCADTFVLSTNKTITVREFVTHTFSAVGIDIRFEGTGVDEVGFDSKGNILVRINPSFYRPAEVDLLIGDNTKAKQLLDWSPSISVEELSKMMVESDLRRNKLNMVF